MHEFASFLVALLTILRRAIFTSRKPGQSFFVNVDTERVETGNCHVDPQVKFKSVKQQGAINVLANYHRLVFVRNLTKIVSYKNSTALRACCRFADP